VKYAWITKHGDLFPIAVMCNVLGVSTSGYYTSVDREPSPRAQRRTRIEASVRQVHAASHGIYGSGKIAQELAQRDDLGRKRGHSGFIKSRMSPVPLFPSFFYFKVQAGFVTVAPSFKHEARLIGSAASIQDRGWSIC